MPKRSASGTRGLIKRHVRGCHTRRHPARCDCAWSGWYQRHEVVLAKWAGIAVPPRDQAAALLVLRRMQAAIDARDFDRSGERAPLGDDQTFRAFIEEWKSRHAEKRGLNQTGLYAMLGRIGASPVGRMRLDDMVGNPRPIEDWLDAEGKRRNWKANTWNHYRDLLYTICEKATQWTANNQPRMATNPIRHIERRVAVQPAHFRQRHFEEEVEARLFEACATLNRPIVTPNKRMKLTPEKAAAIRERLAAGETGKAVAAAFGISRAVVSAIKHGDIWRDESHTRVGTKGTEMERRLIGALDGGLRAGEMLGLQLAHVNWRLQTVTTSEGTQISGYEITLPAELTKTGRRTGETQTIFAATPRFITMLERRRFQLNGKPAARTYIFGTEDGRRQQGFRRMWRALFDAAGLTWGRAIGVVWHTTRHEFISRIAEQTGDPVLAKDMARHADIKTTELYFHSRRSRRLAAAAGVSRLKTRTGI